MTNKEKLIKCAKTIFYGRNWSVWTCDIVDEVLGYKFKNKYYKTMGGKNSPNAEYDVFKIGYNVNMDDDIKDDLNKSIKNARILALLFMAEMEKS
jgi:hypothetical protein